MTDLNALIEQLEKLKFINANAPHTETLDDAIAALRTLAERQPVVDGEVAQADRDAAADQVLRNLVMASGFPAHPPQKWMVDAVKPMRMGAHDDSPEVQASARHRQAAEQRGADRERERIVAWLRSEQGKGSEDGIDYADGFADQIEQGAT